MAQQQTPRQLIQQLLQGLRYKHGIIVLYSTRQAWSTKAQTVIKVHSLDLYDPATGQRENLWSGTKEPFLLQSLADFWGFIERGGDVSDYIESNRQRKREIAERRRQAEQDQDQTDRLDSDQ